MGVPVGIRTDLTTDAAPLPAGVCASACVMPAAWTVNRVGVWGPCGTGNMGNEMTMAALVQNLRQLHPRIFLCGFSANPADTAQRYGIPSLPMMRERGIGSKGKLQSLRRVLRPVQAPLREAVFLNRVRHVLGDLDLLVFAGTGILTDSWGGAARFPYNVFMLSRLARLSGTRVALLSVGAGPIDSALSGRLIRGALRDAAYLSFRDEESKALVESLGVARTNEVCPDLAFSLPVNGAGEGKTARDGEVAIIGLPFRKPGHWEKPSEKVYEQYLSAMTALATWLLAAGHTVRLVATHARMDSAFIEDLRLRVERPSASSHGGGGLIVEPAETFEQIMAQLSTASIVVSSRFHGVVFSYLLGTPVLGVSYHRKMNALMNGFGQQEFCIDVSTVDAASLRECFARLDRTKVDARRRIRLTVAAYREALRAQYAALLRL